MKEMYRFTDQGGEDLALRPEGTASVVRAIISEGIAHEKPHKFFYSGAMFRRERPQKGRLRQFHQAGLEYIGTRSPYADAEVIFCANDFLKRLGIDARLEINTLGSSESRGAWREALRDYFANHKDKLSEDSCERLDRNPLRILDSKDAGDKEISKDAPPFANFISIDDKDYFDKVKKYLEIEKIAYCENPHLVRGLDYYNDTAFEFISGAIGAQGTVLAGGRYDGLSKMIGGPSDMAAVGWAAGIERLMLLANLTAPEKMTVGFLPIDTQRLEDAHHYAKKLRAQSIKVSLFPHGKLEQKMKRAHNLGLKYVILYGDTEFESQKLTLKNMQTGAETLLDFDALAEKLKQNHD